MGVNRELAMKMNPFPWLGTIVLLILIGLFIKGCFIASEEMNQAQDKCCITNSCTWLFQGNCPK